MGNGPEPATLDPHQATGQPELRLLGALVEGLVVRTQTPGRVEPGLAERWDIDSSQTRYTFHLRKALWSDGSPLTAHSLVASWRRFSDPKTAAQYSSLLVAVTKGDSVILGQAPPEHLGVRAVDDTTLVVVLERPTPFFLDLCAFEPFAPVPVDTIDKYGPEWTRAGRFVGNGPYRIASWLPNLRIQLEKNPYYWDTSAVAIPRIAFRPIEDQLMAFQMFRNNELDWTFHVPPSRLRQAKTLPEFFSAPMYGTYYFIANCRQPGFDSPWLRKALSYAIDRRQIVNKVLQGVGRPATGFVPATEPYPELDILAFDTTRAREYLAKSGFSSSHPPPQLEILFNNSETHKNIAEVIKQMWKAYLGLDAELVNFEWKVYLENTRNLNYPALARASWIGDFADPISFLELYASDNGNNRTGYANKAYDSLIEASRRERDATKRLDLLRQAEELLLEDMPVIPIYHYALTEMRTPRLKNAQPNSLGMYTWKNLRLEAPPEQP